MVFRPLAVVGAALILGVAVASSSIEHDAAADAGIRRQRRLGASTTSADNDRGGNTGPDTRRELGSKKSKKGKASKSGKSSKASKSGSESGGKVAKRSDEGGKERRDRDTGDDKDKKNTGEGEKQGSSFDLGDCSSYSTKW